MLLVAASWPSFLKTRLGGKMHSPTSTAHGLARQKSAVLATVAIGVSLTLGACTAPPSAGTPSPSTNVLDRSTTSADAVWEVALSPIAQPEVADGVALVYAKTASGVTAHAISVTDGKEIWNQTVHPGLGAPGVSLTPAITKTSAGASVAVFLQETAAPTNDSGTSWWTAPVAVDLKSGKELYRGDPQLVESRPAACDDELDMCFTSLDAQTRLTTQHRVDLSAGTDSTGPEVNPLTGNFRLVGNGLYSVVEDGREQLARVSAGSKLWEADVQSLFGPGATTNLGWTFEYSKKLDLYIGSVGINPTTETDYARLMEQTFTVDLTKHKTVGFRASTGEKLWTAEGSEKWCSSGVGKTETKLMEGNAFPVRCEYNQGTMVVPGDGYQNAEGKVVGYDPATGEAKWQTKPTSIKAAADLLIPSPSRGDMVLTGGPDGLVIVDTRSGASREATSEDVFLCSKAAKYPLPADAPFPVQPEGNLGTGGSTLFPCDRNAKATPAPATGTLRDIPATNNGVAVLAQENSLSGFKLP